MIYCLGLASEYRDIQQHLDPGISFEFKNFEHTDEIESLGLALLFVIGPAVRNPAKIVQHVVARDKHLSIIILAEKSRYQEVKQSIQYSPAVGKNVLCVIFNLDENYTLIFQNGITRTKQKRSFSKFNSSVETRLSQLNSAAARLDNLGNILEHAPVAAILVDDNYAIIGANKTARIMFNLDQGIHVSLDTIFPVKYAQRIRSHTKNSNDTALIVKDSIGNHYEISIATVPDKDVDNTILLINDITERFEKDKRLKAILESLPQIAWSADEHGNVDYYNQGWFTYTNRQPSEGMGDGWAAIVHPEDVLPLITRWNESVKSGRVFQHAARLRRFDGEYRWHLSKAIPIYSKHKVISMWVGTSTDIHDQVKLNEELERRVSERTKLLEEANAELEQFTHISSHDLQEPLRKIQTFAHIVNDEIPEDVANQNIRRYLGKIISTASRMTILLKDLLSYSQVNQREPTTIVNLNDIIDQIREDLELVVSQYEATIQTGLLPVLNARPLQIKQLFFNLVSNSLKYNKPGTPPIISITSERELSAESKKRFKQLTDDKYCEIVVKDNGIGFDQKHGDQIFTVFQRLHSRSAYEGTGIGLSIAKKVVNNHGGEIFAISSPGNGAEFHVIFPQFRIE